MNRGLGCFFALLLVVAASGVSQAQKASPPKKEPPPKQEESKAAPEALDPQIAIQMADDYFNAAKFMTADFVQVGVEGRPRRRKALRFQARKAAF